MNPHSLRPSLVLLLLCVPVTAQTVRAPGGRTVLMDSTATELEDRDSEVAFLSTDPALRASDLLAAGIEAARPLGPGLWLARVAQSADWGPILAAPAFTGAGRIESGDRLDPHVRAALQEEPAPTFARTADGRWRLSVQLLDPVTDVQTLRAELGVMEARAPEATLRYSGLLLVEIPEQHIDALEARPEVASIELADLPRILVNVTAQTVSEVDTIRAAPYGLDGSGVRVGIWDGGRAGSHTDFAGRRTNVQSGSTSNHATHVTGTLIGDGSGNALAEGMAPAATSYNYDFNGDVAGEMDSAVASYGISASNNSWGINIGWYWNGAGWSMGASRSWFGAYTTSESGALDQVVRDNPELIIVFAAGNDRDEGPAGDLDGTPAPDGERYDLLDPFGVAKNILSVGAVNDDGVTMTGFSSFGPADDGRVKPEVVANGATLLSTLPGDAYAIYSGTSMACPTATGAVLDLVQLHRSLAGGASPTAADMRALIASRADDLHLPGPDARTGYGRLNARRAADLLRLHDAVPLTHQVTDSIAAGQTRDLSFDVPVGTAELSVTLAWTDLPGSGAASVALVNDLDLVLLEPGGLVSHRPWRLDASNPHLAATRGVNSVDNLEQVEVAEPVPGPWTLRVVGTSVSGVQAYSVVSGTNLSLAPAVRLLGGRVTECGLPSPGVSVRLSGDLGDEVVTDSDGRYVFQVPDGSYTITPGSEVLELFPADTSVVLAGSDSLAEDFTAQSNGIVTGNCRYLRVETPGLAIPDNNPAGVTSTLVVGDSFSMTDLQVRVRVTHTYRGDLYIELRAPGGFPSARLRTVDGGDSAANVYGTFDTELTPVDSLTVFDGLDPVGTWELFVSDNFNLDTGTVDEWELILGCPPVSPPDVQTTTLPDATVGLAYSETLQATGGAAPYLWSVVAGSLPDGLTLSPGGALTGVPTTALASTFTVCVLDTLALCGARELTLTVQPAAPATSGICGDCDDSHTVTIIDALQAARIDAGLATLIPGTLAQCDVTGGVGGDVTILDALTISRYIVGLVPALGCTP